MTRADQDLVDRAAEVLGGSIWPRMTFREHEALRVSARALLQAGLLHDPSLLVPARSGE
jgi:hypothetical protein